MSNDYIINWSNGSLKPPFTLAGNAQDTTTTSLILTGKGSSNWGEPLQENQLHLLEHFASDVAPSNPTVGQLWYDSASTTLRIYDVGGAWKPIYSLNSVSKNTAPASPSDGQFWYDTTVKILKHWNGSEWIPVYTSTSLTNESAPISPKVGQLWYRASVNQLSVYNGTQWVIIFTGNAISSSSAPASPVRGQLWFDTVNNILKIYDNSNSFVPISGGAIAITGDLNMNNFKIINLASGVSSSHGVNKGQLDAINTNLQNQINTINTTLGDHKLYKVITRTPGQPIPGAPGGSSTSGVVSNGWTIATYSGQGSATTWPAAWAPGFPYISTYYVSTNPVTIVGPAGKTYRVLIMYNHSCTFANPTLRFNSAFKGLVDGVATAGVNGGNWAVAGDVGFFGTGGDHGHAKYQNAASLSTSDHTMYIASFAQTFTGTHTFEVRTWGICYDSPGATTYILASDATFFVYVD